MVGHVDATSTEKTDVGDLVSALAVVRVPTETPSLCAHIDQLPPEILKPKCNSYSLPGTAVFHVVPNGTEDQTGVPKESKTVMLVSPSNMEM
jgi:hypothetical protein